MDGPSNFLLVTEEMVPWEEQLKYIIQCMFNYIRSIILQEGYNSLKRGHTYHYYQSWISYWEFSFRSLTVKTWLNCIYNVGLYGKVKEINHVFYASHLLP